MVRQKIGAWIRARKRATLKRNLQISDAQADELLAIVAFRRGAMRHATDDMQALQSVLNEPIFEAQALESLIDRRLQGIKHKLESRAQAFTGFVGSLNSAQRHALSNMLARHRCGGHRPFVF